MTTLAEFMILFGGDNPLPMLDKDLYDSWKNRMELYIQNREHERMILESFEHGPLICPTIEENGSLQYGSTHPTQHYSSTYPSTPALTYPSTPYPNAYSSIHQEACPQSHSAPQIEYIVSAVNQQTHLAEFPQIDCGLAVPVFKQGDDHVDAINKMMSFLFTIVASRFPSTNNQLRNSSNLRQQATMHDGWVTVQPLHGRPNSYANGTSGIELILQEHEGIIQVNKAISTLNIAENHVGLPTWHSNDVVGVVRSLLQEEVRMTLTLPGLTFVDLGL
uniref:Integrase, catalytic region, zinc finger, CCHC-type, peptidase aspartic, catalytic n=1 Tax=Tanacetum cinerariifolium TaxID=118510 RepID=A0A6L2PC17_TANCI|nr:hypothetical protein [Tanacetum cinerariifolium]